MKAADVLASWPAGRKRHGSGPREDSVVSNMQKLRRALEPALRRVFHLYWRLARGMTLGVRGLVLDDAGRVFLIRHTYVSGWHLPGGGVEVGETFREALCREVMEEGRIEIVGEPDLHGVFLNSHVSPRDHVAVYVIRQFRQDRVPAPNREIAESGFFAVDALPAGTTLGTRLRIAEVLDGARPPLTWRPAAEP
ncbi:NUDIX hydrolase [Rhodopseudomonas palustris BisB18]|uniref:NUDIX hydrolase n=2 Tax=Rhodopseudomonas palustris TaxID=1076 RepID=Q219J1_RHOPB